MFEKKIPEPGQPDSSQGEFSEEVLQDLSWTELAARLAAARDLRRELDLPEGSGQASFDANFARQLAGQEDGKPTINRMGLAHGKQAGDKDGGTSQDAVTGNRGSE